MVEDTLCPLRQSISRGRACNGFGYIGSEEPLVWSGPAVRWAPFPLCLSALELAAQPIRRSCPLDGLKVFPSLVRLGFTTVPALVVHFQDGIRSRGWPRCSDQCLRPPGFPQGLTS